MGDVEPMFKANKGPCEGNQDRCSLGRGDEPTCPLWGTLGKAGRDGARRVRGCGDPVASGKRSRSKGDREERKAARLLGATGANTRHEEHRGGPLRYESKAGAQVGPIWTRFQSARAQSEQSRSIGDHRPFVMVAAPDGTPEQLLIVSSKDWPQVVAAAAEDMGMTT